MNAIQVSEYGDASVLNCVDLPKPEPAGDELLVRVYAAGVNPIDWMVREGYADEALDPPLPYVPGWDLSGVVESVGEDVHSFAQGDSVFGLVRMPDPGNAYAEFAAVPAEDVVLAPESLDHTRAAGVPMAALTAWRALFEEGELGGGERVLVHAAAGGVGHMAVQFADHVGAHVIGTASGRNEAYLRELGVEEFVNYREQPFETVVDDVDLVLDAVGDDVLERSIDVLANDGRIVTLPEPPGKSIAERLRAERDGTVRWFSVEPDSTALATIRDLIDEGHVEPTISNTWPLSDAASAHAESQGGHVRGKLVLEVRSEGRS